MDELNIAPNCTPTKTMTTNKWDKNAEGAKHGHLRVTMGPRNGGRGAVVYHDELLSASQGV